MSLNKMNSFQQALHEAGVTNERLLAVTIELIEAIVSGKFKPKNKEKKLSYLLEMKRVLNDRIENNKNE